MKQIKCYILSEKINVTPRNVKEFKKTSKKFNWEIIIFGDSYFAYDKNNQLISIAYERRCFK